MIDQILVIDAKNDYARGVRPLVEDRALIYEHAAIASNSTGSSANS